MIRSSTNFIQPLLLSLLFSFRSFVSLNLVQNGIVPRPDAERLLRQAVQTNKTGGPGNQAAADLLAIFLDQVPMFQPPTRQ
jgi:hypothetical protein